MTYIQTHFTSNEIYLLVAPLYFCAKINMLVYAHKKYRENNKCSKYIVFFFFFTINLKEKQNKIKVQVSGIIYGTNYEFIRILQTHGVNIFVEFKL